MIPDGWQEQKLEKVAKVIDCKHRTPSYVEDGIPLISPGTIKWGALNLSTPTKRVTKEEYQSLMDHCSINIGDLVLGRNQSVGIAAYVTCDKPFVLGQDTVLIQASSIEPKYLFYGLQSNQVQRKVFKLAGGSTFSRINLGDIRKLPISYPPLPEQKKIAQILSTWDKAIETVEKLIENSQQKKKALMQQLLTGKKRFPGFDGAWKKVRLGDIASIGTGSSKTKFIDEGGERFIIDMGSISRDGKLIPSKRTNYADNYLSKGQLVMPKDDIGGGNIIGRVGYIDQSNLYILGDHVYALTIKNEDNLFMSYLINGEIVNKSLRRKANGTAQLGLGKKDVEKQSVTIPTSIKEQQKIASVLSSSDQEIETWQQELEHLKQEKKALMQQLLAGKKRVKV